MTPTISRLGDTALLVTFDRHVTRQSAARVQSVAAEIHNLQPHGVVDVVPAYATVALHFDPVETTFELLAAQVENVLHRATEPTTVSAREVEIPVRYNGVDLEAVAERCGLSVSEVIQRHVAPLYHVYMLGFAPGFAYLGDLDPALVLERRSDPRQRVPPGSVAIASAQTAVYPLATAGGWHIIGSTPLVMFDPMRNQPALLRVGDVVRFTPIS